MTAEVPFLEELALLPSDVNNKRNYVWRELPNKSEEARAILDRYSRQQQFITMDAQLLRMNIELMVDGRDLATVQDLQLREVLWVYRKIYNQD